MFQLEKHIGRFQNLNLRKERHGEEEVPAADMKFQVTAQNKILDTIDPRIVPAFWKKAEKGQNENLPTEDSTDLVALNLPLLGEQDITGKFEGYELEIGSLLDRIEPVFFADVKVKAISWKALEGGSVVLSFTASSLIEADDGADLLSAWTRGQVCIDLTPPTANTAQQELDV